MGKATAVQILKVYFPPDTGERYFIIVIPLIDPQRLDIHTFSTFGVKRFLKAFTQRFPLSSSTLMSDCAYDFSGRKHCRHVVKLQMKPFRKCWLWKCQMALLRRRIILNSGNVISLFLNKIVFMLIFEEETKFTNIHLFIWLATNKCISFIFAKLPYSFSICKKNNNNTNHNHKE